MHVCFYYLDGFIFFTFQRILTIQFYLREYAQRPHLKASRFIMLMKTINFYSKKNAKHMFTIVRVRTHFVY